MDNQTPMPGTPAAVLASFQASNFLKNSTFEQANKYRTLYDTLGIPSLAVLDIVAIQTNGGGATNDGAETVSFGDLRNFGIKETDFLYLHLKRKGHGEGNFNYECIGDTQRLVNSVGNDETGQKNTAQALINIAEAVDPNLDAEDLMAAVVNQPDVKAEAKKFLAKYLG